MAVGQRAYLHVTQDVNVVTVIVVVVVSCPEGGHPCGAGFTDPRSKEQEALVDVLAIDWCGPKTLSTPSPWSTLWAPPKRVRLPFGMGTA